MHDSAYLTNSFPTRASFWTGDCIFFTRPHCGLFLPVNATWQLNTDDLVDRPVLYCEGRLPTTISAIHSFNDDDIVTLRFLGHGSIPRDLTWRLKVCKCERRRRSHKQRECKKHKSAHHELPSLPNYLSQFGRKTYPQRIGPQYFFLQYRRETGMRMVSRSGILG